MSANAETYLISRLQKGDRGAFLAVYDMYAPRLLAYCMAHLDSSQAAQDVVQDIFTALWQRRESLLNLPSLKPYLFASARNMVINYWKSKINSNLYADYVATRGEHTTQHTYGGIEYSDFEKLVKDLVGQLPPTQAKVVRLSRFDNLDNKEIALVLGLKEQTIKNALSQGLKTLRELLIKRGIILFASILTLLF